MAVADGIMGVSQILGHVSVPSKVYAYGNTGLKAAFCDQVPRLMFAYV